MEGWLGGSCVEDAMIKSAIDSRIRGGAEVMVISPTTHSMTQRRGISADRGLGSLGMMIKLKCWDKHLREKDQRF